MLDSLPKVIQLSVIVIWKYRKLTPWKSSNVKFHSDLEIEMGAGTGILGFFSQSSPQGKADSNFTKS